jgi:hypothetical protein
MKKLRTPSHLADYLDQEFSWRLKEIADIKTAIIEAEPTLKRSILRAGLPILYAHWEGFIKKASEALLNFITHQSIQYRLLKPCYIVFGVKKVIRDMVESSNTRQNIAAVEFFLSKLDSQAAIVAEGAIKTKSNLSSRMFERIASSVGVDVRRYETKYIFIDKSLLERRNNIAHGEYLDLNQDDYLKIAEEVIALLRGYKTDIENIVSTNSYKA